MQPALAVASYFHRAATNRPGSPPHLYRSDTALLTLGDAQVTQGESPAVLRQTGIYLTEDGKAGTLQQIDLRV